jgi:hypothetical protein
LAAPLDAESSFLLDETNALRRRGYTNALVTHADLHAPFLGKSDVRLHGIPMRILSLLPLTPDEIKMKVERGADALMEYFNDRGRDLLTLSAPG